MFSIEIELDEVTTRIDAMANHELLLTAFVKQLLMVWILKMQQNLSNLFQDCGRSVTKDLECNEQRFIWNTVLTISMSKCLILINLIILSCITLFSQLCAVLNCSNSVNSMQQLYLSRVDHIQTNIRGDLLNCNELHELNATIVSIPS